MKFKLNSYRKILHETHTYEYKNLSNTHHLKFSYYLVIMNVVNSSKAFTRNIRNQILYSIRKLH